VKLRFTPRATRDLAEIAEYLRTRNPSSALAVKDAILRSLQNLTLFPAIGRPQDVQGVRKLVTPKYRYLVYYMIDEVAEEIASSRFSIPRAVVNTGTSNFDAGNGDRMSPSAKRAHAA
jgi:toxin ParE1/3/4